MPDSEAKSLYFIAIMPDDPLLSEVNTIKQTLAVKYKLKASLKSPAHITLFPPFHWEQKKEKDLINALSSLPGFRDFEVVLNGYGHFSDNVIFIKPDHSPELKELFKKLHHHLKATIGLVSPYFEKTKFHPHMTVVHRDLSLSDFDEIWADFEHKAFFATFNVKQVTLLKHTGLKWEIMKFD